MTLTDARRIQQRVRRMTNFTLAKELAFSDALAPHEAGTPEAQWHDALHAEKKRREEK